MADASTGEGRSFRNPIAALIAMKPGLGQSALFSTQRLSGALIGAGVAMLLLLIPANESGSTLISIERGLEVVALMLFMHGFAIRFWNYALYTATIAAGVLILVDLPQPSDYGAEGDRVLWTLCGVGIGVIVMFLADLLAKHAAPRPTAHPSPHPGDSHPGDTHSDEPHPDRQRSDLSRRSGS